MAFSLVQQTDEFGSLSLAYGSGNTTGNFLACVLWTNGAGTFLVSDSQGNSWSAAHTALTVGSDLFQLWYAPNCKAGANTVSTTGSVAGNTLMMIAEFSGIKTFSPLDSATAGGSSSTTPNLTTTQPGDLLIAYVGNNSGGITYVPGAGYTLIANSTGVVGWAFATAGAAGTYSTAFTGGNGIAALAGFFAQPAAPPSGGPGTGMPPFGWVNTQGNNYNKRGLK
jgi:hypothetical protein